MKHLANKSIALIVGILALLLSGQSLGASYVLCVGESGNTAFEKAVIGKCAPAQPACPAENEYACAHDYAGICHDYSTSAFSLRSRYRGDQNHLTAWVVPVITAAPSPRFMIVRDLAPAIPPEPISWPNASLVALGTIVLLN
ncbi:MAG: hypothetical protein C4519_10100 [Desulfobacteraceae bacterium]|nr:MAG: hypothetical protein C4519_10100 [Desulfobacteraceae bacterium]